MRWMLRIFGWMGLGLSTVLLAGTAALWVRSIGYWEEWRFVRFEPRPDWRASELAGTGIEQTWSVEATDGRPPNA